MPAPRLIYFVSGMWCSTCANTVCESVHNVDGVQSANLNYANKLLLVKTRPRINSDNIDKEIQKIVQKIGFGIKKQSDGWISNFHRELSRESHQKLTWLHVSVVWFLAMWASMLAFASYMGGLSNNELFYLSLASSVVGLPAILLGIVPYARAGVRAFYFSRLITLDLFIFLGGLSAIAVSVYGLTQGGHVTYADSGSMIIAILLLTKKMESVFVKKVSGEILYRLHSDQESVEVLHQGGWQRVENARVKLNNRIRLQKGETIPFDGFLYAGPKRINNHLLSGEDVPVSLKTGDDVWAGAIALEPLEVVVSAPQGLRKIDAWAEAALVSDNGKNPYTKFFSRVEEILVLSAFSGAFGIGLWQWLQGQPYGVVVESFFVGVLIFCPCLFASIIPLARQISNLSMMKMGIVAHRSEALLDLARANTFYFDKTGTLESAEAVYVPLDLTVDVRPEMAALVSASSHITLRSLLLPNSVAKNKIESLHEFPGQGLFAQFEDGEKIWVGRCNFLKEHNIFCDDSSDPTLTYVARGDRVVGYILRRSQHKLSTQQFLKKLRQFLPSAKIEILSGDPDHSAGEEYLKLGADIAYKGNLQPEQKAQHIHPQSVFVGDGLNDTLALSKADVSIRVGERVRGFCVADFQLASPHLSLILDLIGYAKKYRRVLVETAAAALVYNLIAFSLAFKGGFSPLGAVIAMSTSFSLMLLSVWRLNKIERF